MNPPQENPWDADGSRGSDWSPNTADALQQSATDLDSEADENQVGGAGSSGSELCFLGNYDNDWSNLTDEQKALADGKWSPATSDFDAVAAVHVKSSAARVITGNLAAFFTEIASASKKLRRVNFISHGSVDLSLNPTGVGIKGKVLRGGGVQSDDLMTADRLRDEIASDKALVARVKKNFASNAELYLIVCNGGASPDLIQALGDLIAVKVFAWRDKIAFCPPLDLSDRSFTSVASCGGRKRGYKHLIPQVHYP